MVPGDTLFGAACTRRFTKFPTCKWLNCNVPDKATTSGVYSVDCVPSAPSCVLSSLTRYSRSRTLGGRGLDGMRQDKGASLWM
jgi:hypothetical protein